MRASETRSRKQRDETMNAADAKAVRIAYEWRIVEKATGRTVTTGTIKMSASSSWQTHEGLLESARSSLRDGRIFRQEIVRHWIED